MTQRFVDQRSQPELQVGDGWKDTLVSGFNRLSNLLPDADSNARKAFPEEKHAISRNKEGKWVRSNFTGPGTRIAARVRRGDPPRNLVDEISLYHDARYGLANPSRLGSVKEAEDAVRKADLKMVAGIQKAKKQGESKFNTIPAELGIRGKMKAEDYSLLSKNAFISSNPISKADEELLEGVVEQGEKRGYGRPGERLLATLNKKEKRRRRRK